MCVVLCACVIQAGVEFMCVLLELFQVDVLEMHRAINWPTCEVMWL